MKLEKILTEIQARKIEFDRNKLIDWLRVYADYYKRHYKTKLTVEEIMIRKINILFRTADMLYWEYCRPFELKLYPKSKIPQICREDKKAGLYV